MYCDLIELPYGVTRPRYHPRPYLVGKAGNGKGPMWCRRWRG